MDYHTPQLLVIGLINMWLLGYFHQNNSSSLKFIKLVHLAFLNLKCCIQS